MAILFTLPANGVLGRWFVSSRTISRFSQCSSISLLLLMPHGRGQSEPDTQIKNKLTLFVIIILEKKKKRENRRLSPLA